MLYSVHVKKVIDDVCDLLTHDYNINYYISFAMDTNRYVFREPKLSCRASALHGYKYIVRFNIIPRPSIILHRK